MSDDDDPDDTDITTTGHSSDGLVEWMKKLDIPITRENFISANWGDDLPEKWDAEAEDQIPPELQDWSWLNRE